jgi:hypothetical protein
MEDAMTQIEEWEKRFEAQYQKIARSDREKPGALLPLIPCRGEWEEFLEYIRSEWRIFNGYAVRQDQPHCLVILFGGIAFYEYDENRFWPQFAQAVGNQHLPTNQQHEISEDFVRAMRKLGLKIHQREHRMDYVGSAVYHIGIPLSLWGGFLEICEWALLHDNWEEMSDAKWAEIGTKRALNRPRLRNFLTNNREAATIFIREMHDARRILTDDENLSINDLKQASLLRPEYFDEIPETAEFLRPSNPDSLFKDRARLVWYEDGFRISLHLPAVSRDKLPATWTVGDLTQPASATADILPLNSAAFTTSLLLKLESSGQSEVQRLRGIAPFGLFDCERKKFVNPEREALPIGSYELISREVLPDLMRRGFDDEEHRANEREELEDGAPYHITRLRPIGKSAEISFSQLGETKKIAFRSGLKIEARIFAGEGSYAANFNRYQEWIKVERLPLLCLAVPFGSFEEPGSALQCKFQVRVGEQITEGTWEKRHEDEHQEFYIWRWINEPQPRKKVNVSVRAPDLGIGFDYQIEMLQPKPGLADCWQNLPGAFLPWCLLTQPVAGMKEGMKWQDLLLAREAIAPNDKTSPNQLRYRLREYVNCGLLAQRGHTWMIAESLTKFHPSDDGLCQMSYCGNPAILWGLFRYLHDQIPDLPLPPVEVANRRGELPYLLMQWKAEQRGLVQKYLTNQRQHNVRIVSDLWRP